MLVVRSGKKEGREEGGWEGVQGQAGREEKCEGPIRLRSMVQASGSWEDCIAPWSARSFPRIPVCERTFWKSVCRWVWTLERRAVLMSHKRPKCLFSVRR